jgi:malate dehydrogenase (oxaloacetate-decarboxylating)
MDKNNILKLHKSGKMEIKPTVPLKTKTDLSIAYTPGVAEVCLEIKNNPYKSYDYTIKNNSVAIITDGSAVLGLGDIGPAAALPVMEGKAILFKEFGNVDAYPICLSTKNPEKIIEIISLISVGFGGINLEDISSPRCFLIEESLKKKIDIPVFHDDQHGTAIVVLAALINALKISEQKISEVKIVINGAGAAGIAITKFLYKAGAKKIVLCDKSGIIYKGRKKRINFAKKEVTKYLLKDSKPGSLKDAIEKANVFIGVSGPNMITKEMIKTMDKKPIIFAMANPIPEIMPDEAKRAGAFIIGTGRSDFPNQINNLLAFPGIFRGALDIRAKKITEKMKLESAKAIADMVSEKNLNPENIIPSPLNKEVAKKVAQAVKKSYIQ